ncbi:RNA polymerase sigma factor [Streptomyces sp. KM273126]|uniref:RNA polymerase sigma factor n=1 Tax=Streptomyces sp. KM273126 TaxID=2545247 RepID=UPI00103CB0AE|nr:RNA polymerase sigma factor [Streptomyces sp. KM273126]MBA2809097.1 RNA polymerase sigma factor [Streptomyces sp. KM273126]
MEERSPHDRAERTREFAECVLPEVEMLLRVATTLTARPDHAEELVRATLLRAYRTLERCDGRQPRTWLLTLMYEERTDRRRARGPRPRRDRDTGPRPSPAGVSGQSAKPVVVGPSFHEVVDFALAALPVRYRQVVRLVDIDGLSYAEAAGSLGTSEATVKSRLRRARRRIRVRLAAAGLVPGRGER